MEILGEISLRVLIARALATKIAALPPESNTPAINDNGQERIHESQFRTAILTIQMSKIATSPSATGIFEFYQPVATDGLGQECGP